MKPSLIPDAADAWRFASVRVALLATAWGAMPVEWQTAILTAAGVPIERVPAVFGVLFLLFRVFTTRAPAAPAEADDGVRP
jgi:hypothetical protein